MKKTWTLIIIVLVIVVVGLALWYWNPDGNPAVTTISGTPTSTTQTSSSQPAALTQLFTSNSMGLSINFPANYAEDTNYQYQELGPGKSINGVKFTIDPTMASGTNLSTDSYISVEELPNIASCTAGKFLDLSSGGSVTSFADPAVPSIPAYSFASSTGAAAGNRYEEEVFAIPGTNPCVAVRYFIHYGVIDNYPPGAVQPFDQAALLTQFDAIRESLTLQK